MIMRVPLAAVLAVTAVLAAGEQPPPASDPPVVIVDGEPIRLRHLEDEMLSKEGADLMMELVQQAIGQIEWAALGDDAPLVTVGQYRIDRRRLAVQLLRQSAAKVREDMIDALLVERRLRRDGIILTEPTLDLEVARLDRAFAAELAERKQPMVPFAAYLQQQEGLTIEQLKRQAAFRMLTGLHVLVFRGTPVPDDTLKRFFRDRYDRFARDEQVELAQIFIPFDARAQIDPMAKTGPRNVLTFCYREILAGRADFAKKFNDFGRGWDPQAEASGRIGWVGSDGVREQVGAKAVPREVMQRCFAADRGALPVLLEPIESADGVYLIRIDQHRPALRPEFAEVAGRVREVYLEDNLKQFSQEMMQRLRREAKVEYQDLAVLIEQRAATVAPPPAPVPAPDASPPAPAPTPAPGE